MPIYEYTCEKCGKEEEIFQKMKDPPPQCEKCKIEMKKHLSLGSFQLKGSGWYATDYKPKGRKK